MTCWRSASTWSTSLSPLRRAAGTLDKTKVLHSHGPPARPG